MGKPIFKKLRFLPLILAALWVGLVFVPILYGIAFSPPDFSALIRGLEMNGEPPPGATSAVKQIVGAAGRLQRVVPVSYYTSIEARLQPGASRTTKRTQMGYVAWFQNTHKPILLLINRLDSSDGVRNYSIGEGEPASMIRAFGLPLLCFFLFLYLALRKTSQEIATSA